MILLAYPGYTLKKIEDELSWRQVEKLFEAWGDEEPEFRIMGKLKAIMEKHTGLKFTEKKKRKKAPSRLSSKELVAHLQGRGWI